MARTRGAWRRSAGARHGPIVALACVCLLSAGIAGAEAVSDAPTIDEPVYVSAGVASLVRHDLRLNTQHPPLAKALAALPVLLAHPTLPTGPVWAHARDRPYARRFAEDARRRDQLHAITLLSRLVPLLVLLLTGILVFVLGRRLGGATGGVFAAALWLLNPYVVGIGHVDGIDIPATAATLGVVLALVRWSEAPSRGRLVVTGLACGAAVLVRDTGPLLVAASAGVVAWRVREARSPLLVIGVALATVWAAYLALDPGYTLHHLNVVPQRYGDGLGALLAAHQHAAPAFLFGHLWAGGRWWFWPGSMLVKLPASMLVAFALMPVALRRTPATPRATVLAALVPCALLLGAFTVLSPVDLGLRYLLPVIALGCVAVAGLVRLPRAVPLVLVGVGAAFTVASAPHSIAWIAPPFGPGYEVASAGNLDWGQDAWRLQDWARGRHAWVACYAPGGTGCIQDVPGTRALTKRHGRAGVHGWVAISATLRNLHEWDGWLRRFAPAGVIGGTELVYRIP